MYAVVQTGGRQYKVSKGDLIKVQRLAGEIGDKVELDDVLLFRDDKGVTVGTPAVAGTKVVGKITSHGRDKKILIFKQKRRKNYRRTKGHRQDYTWLLIEDIISAQGGTSGTQKGRGKLEKRT